MTTSTTRNWAGLFFDKGAAVFNVKHPDFDAAGNHGAKGDGVTDDTQAIKDAISAAVSNGGGVVFFPPATAYYKVTDTLAITVDNVVLVGCGSSSVIRFKPPTMSPPAGGYALIRYEGAQPNGIKNAGIRHLRLRSDTTDSDIFKVAIDCHDVRDFRLEDVQIGVAGTGGWSNTAGTCIGLRARGRQSSSFTNLTSSADVPVKIAINDDGSNGTIGAGTLDSKDLDHFSFRDLLLMSTTAPNPVVVVQPGAILRNTNFGGYVSFVNGGLSWVDGGTVPRGATTDDKKSNNIVLENIRAEQIGANATTYTINVQKNSAGPLYELTLRNTLIGPLAAGWSGLRADNVYRVLAEQVRYEGAQTAYNITGGEILNGLSSGELTGLQVTWKTASQVEIAPGRCRSDDNSYDIVVTAPITVDITVSGAGGRDTGAEAANTWYAVWLIGKNRDSATNPQNGLLSVSGTAPTMPSNYQVKRLLGWVRNDGSSNFRNFNQRGAGKTRRHHYDDARANLTSAALTDRSATTFTDLDISAWVPPGCDLAILQVGLRVPTTTGTNTDVLQLRPKGATSSDGPWAFGPGVTMVTTNSPKCIFGPFEMPTDANRLIQYKVTDADDRADVFVLGFDHEL